VARDLTPKIGDKRNLGKPLGTQGIDEIGLCFARECGFNNRANGSRVRRRFVANGHVRNLRHDREERSR
jgi:hypothetical protein